MIWISDEWKDYEVLDATDGERLEVRTQVPLEEALGQVL